MEIQHIVSGYANVITGSYNKELSNQRLELCKLCVLYIPGPGLCNPSTVRGIKGCGCFVLVKSTVPEAKCPHDVWTTGHTFLTLK